jgi:predicted TIM-barrel enzyme
MDALLKTFTKSHVVLPVIHALSVEQSVEQSRIAVDCGADGVFVIWHGGSWEQLGSAVDAVKQRVGGWVGANALDLTAEQTFERFTTRFEVDGVWCDNAEIDERTTVQTAAQAIDRERETFGGLYFGGVAFKYQRRVSDLELAATIARKHVDVICTSGSGTGSAPTVSHVSPICAGAGSTPVAIASGIDRDNVATLIGAGGRAFLVATSVETSHGVLDPIKLQQLVDATHAAI